MAAAAFVQECHHSESPHELAPIPTLWQSVEIDWYTAAYYSLLDMENIENGAGMNIEEGVYQNISWLGVDTWYAFVFVPEAAGYNLDAKAEIWGVYYIPFYGPIPLFAADTCHKYGYITPLI